MIAIDLDDLQRIATESFNRANRAARALKLSRAEVPSHAEQYSAVVRESHSLSDHPQLGRLDHFEGMRA